MEKISQQRLIFLQQMLSFPSVHHHAFAGRFALIEGAHKEGKYDEMLEYVQSCSLLNETNCGEDDANNAAAQEARAQNEVTAAMNYASTVNLNVAPTPRI